MNTSSIQSYVVQWRLQEYGRTTKVGYSVVDRIGENEAREAVKKKIARDPHEIIDIVSIESLKTQSKE